MSQSDKKPFVPTDLLSFEFVGDPQISPDGSRVAFVRSVVDATENKYRRAIMVAPAAPAAANGKGAVKPFTSGVNSDTSPRWSPDGRYLAFLSSRDAGVGDEQAKKKAGAQIWVAPTSGGEARPITAIKGGATGFVWSPDSRFIAFTALVKAEGPEWLDTEPEKPSGEGKTGADGEGVEPGKPGGSEGPAEPDAGAAGGSSRTDLEALFRKHNEDVKRIARAFYRSDGTGYLEDKRSHVFVIDVEAALAGPPGSPPPVRPVQVTFGDFDHSDPAWSPDGKMLAVGACRDENSDMQRYQDIWLFAVPEGGEGGAGSGKGTGSTGAEPKRLTDRTGPFHGPAWSPDGRRVAFLGHERELAWYTDDKVWLVDVGPDGSPAGKPLCLTASFGRAFGDSSISDMRSAGADPRPVFSPDGKTLFLPASDHGTTHLMAVDVASGKVSQLTTGDWVIFGWSADQACRTFAFALATADNPNDIYVGRLPESQAKWPAAPAGLADLDVIARQPITRTNADLLKSRFVSRPERFTFAAPGGPTVDGWVIRPVGFEGSKTYPAVLEIHGGPMAMYTGAFFLEFQLLAAAGIGVIYTNPRGSQGYGEQFCAGIKDEWGKNDYADLMAGVDEALRRFPWIDAHRLGVTGGSYGGYMTSWIVGHTTRFRAACSTRAVNNCHSFFGTSDTGFQWDEIWHGTPWKDPENLIRQSPITYAGNVKTPTLVIHNEDDHRCLIEQGEQMFIALKKVGVETEFVRYPGESHGLSRGGKPWHRVHRLKTIVDWFERKLKDEEPKDTEPKDERPKEKKAS